MRRWLALLAGVAAIAVTGTALAMTGSGLGADGDAVTETTLEAKTPTTIEEVQEKDRPDVDDVEKDEWEWEEPGDYVPYEPRDHDVTPPEIEILFPEDGQVFERSEVAFEGITEPGAKVFVGDRRADVGDDGSWRIVLHLEKGENHIKVKAKDEAGNRASDSVTVIYQAPEPKAEEPKKEEPKEVEWKFSAHQAYGECSENPPYDVFYGTGKPGSRIVIEAEFARKVTEVNDHGEWEVKVIFEGAPVGETFKVHVVDEYGHHEVFKFTHTD